MSETSKLRELLKQKLAKGQTQQQQAQSQAATGQAAAQSQTEAQQEAPTTQVRKLLQKKVTVPEAQQKGIEKERVQVEEVMEEAAPEEETESIGEELAGAETELMEEVAAQAAEQKKKTAPRPEKKPEEKKVEIRKPTVPTQQQQQVGTASVAQQIAQQVAQQVQQASPGPVATAQAKIQQITARMVSVGAVPKRRVTADDLLGELERIEKRQVKYAILIFGDKDSGKTVAALSFPGRILALSFDGKTERVWKGFYREDSRIKIINLIEFWDTSTPERAVESAYELYYAMLDSLDRYVQKYGEPDWILIDYASTFVEICEAAARYMHGIRTMISGAPWNVWRERNYLIEGAHNKFMRVAKRGVIYTCYPRVSPEEIYEGQIITQRRVPKWLDDMVAKMDIVLETLFKDREKKYVVKVWACKIPEVLKPGDVIDVTGKPFWNALLEKNPDVEKILFPNMFEEATGE